LVKIRLHGKTTLFKFKILLIVILKYKLQSQQVDGTQKGIEYVFEEKLKGERVCFCMIKDFVKKRFVLKDKNFKRGIRSNHQKVQNVV
jgi:hypothetical protein